MEGKRITIIIPVYNSERFLPQCLESILSQMVEDDELLIIDDASTDHSLSICKSYKEINPSQIQIISKSQHNGPSDSRNIGTENASGKYLCFIDSDDWLAPNALDEMWQFVEKNDCDIVQSGFYYAYDSYLLISKKLKRLYPHPTVISKERSMEHLVKDGVINNFIWGKLYKTELAKKNRFPINVNMGEDLFWQHRVIDGANNVGILPIPLYYYRQNPNGLSNAFSEQHITLLYAMEDRLAFVRHHYPSLVPSMLYVLWKQAYQSLEKAQRSGNNSYKKLFGDYWNNFNQKHQQEFGKMLTHKLDYYLYCKSPVLLKIYSFIDRVIDYFTSDYQHMKFDQ